MSRGPPPSSSAAAAAAAAAAPLGTAGAVMPADRPVTPTQQQPPLQMPPPNPGSTSSCSSSASLLADGVCLANPACWYCRSDGLVLPVPPVTWVHQAGNGSGNSSTGDVGAAAAAGPGGAELPVVWLQVSPA